MKTFLVGISSHTKQNGQGFSKINGDERYVLDRVGIPLQMQQSLTKPLCHVTKFWTRTYPTFEKEKQKKVDEKAKKKVRFLIKV